VKVKIAKGNSKMGKVAHVNLPPCRTCNRELPCYEGGCYSQKAYRMYPGTREAWDNNWLMQHKFRDEYFLQIGAYINAKRPDLFRWHSAGDVPDGDYMRRIYEMAYLRDWSESSTKFLLFTKKYELLMNYVDRRKPVFRDHANLKVVVSAWPGLVLPKKTTDRFPVAYMRDPVLPDIRIPEDARPCSGRCDECGLCWELKTGESMVFDKH